MYIYIYVQPVDEIMNNSGAGVWKQWENKLIYPPSPHPWFFSAQHSTPAVPRGQLKQWGIRGKYPQLTPLVSSCRTRGWDCTPNILLGGQDPGGPLHYTLCPLVREKWGSEDASREVRTVKSPWQRLWYHWDQANQCLSAWSSWQRESRDHPLPLSPFL